MLDKCIDLVTKLVGQAADRLCRAVVGVLHRHQRAAARARHQIRPLADAPRPPALLRAGRRQLDQDRLFQEAVATGWCRCKRGHETDLIEIPASWYLDDLPPMMFIKKAPNSHGFVNPRDIEQMWRDQFDWVYREYDYAVFPITIHPDVSGRPHVLMMLERLYQHMIAPSGREVRHHGRDGRRLRQALRRARSSRRCARSAACWAGPSIGPTPMRGPASSRATPGRWSGAASGRAASPTPTASWRHFGLTLSDWQGTAFLLVDPHRQDRDRRQPERISGSAAESAARAARAIRSIRALLAAAGAAGVSGIPDFTPGRSCSPAFSAPARRRCWRACCRTRRSADTAVLINEFGEVGLDHHLLERIDDTMVLLPSGCLCCTIRGELSDAIKGPAFAPGARRGAAVPPARDRERPGSPIPLPVLATITADPVLKHHFRMGAVVTTVDAVNGLDTAGPPARERQAGGGGRPAGADQDRSRARPPRPTPSSRPCARSTRMRR